ncbi:unnamed protein product [Ectocarpus sp. 13 AM-2016]
MQGSCCATFKVRFRSTAQIGRVLCSCRGGSLGTHDAALTSKTSWFASEGLNAVAWVLAASRNRPLLPDAPSRTGTDTLPILRVVLCAGHHPLRSVGVSSSVVCTISDLI